MEAKLKRRVDKLTGIVVSPDREIGDGGMVSHSSPKKRLDPDFLPRCAREIRVCAFH